MSVDILADDLHFGEGPRWHQGKLWFSDFYDYAVKTVDLEGTVATKLTVDGQPSGLGWMPDGRMLVVSMTDRMLLRLEHDALVVHADLSEIATFHCNDMVVDTAGRAYVGNFGFDLDAAVTSGDFAGALAAYEGAAIARVDPDGSIHTAAAGLRSQAENLLPLADVDDIEVIVLREAAAILNGRGWHDLSDKVEAAGDAFVAEDAARLAAR